MSFNSTFETAMAFEGTQNIALVAASCFIGITVLLWTWTRDVSDPREPPLLKPRFPVIGHLLGIMQHEAEYFQRISARKAWPIVTLKIFTTRIYVVTSGELIQAVFRNSKAITFEPIANAGSERVFAISKPKMEALLKHEGDSKDSTMAKTTGGMHTSLLPGPKLLEMNSRALDTFAVFLENIDSDGKAINLHAWVRDCFTLSSAEAVYGHDNPIANDHSLIQSLEDFGSSVGPLFLNILPSITARKGHLARLAFTEAFKPYYASGAYKNASGLVLDRHTNLTAGGMTHDDLASFDIGVVIASVMNSVEGMFWILCYLFSSPLLLAEVREEVESIATRSEEGKKICLDVSGLQKDCPLLISVWQETLRLAGVAVSSRVVASDVMLNDTYLLKRNSVVQIPARVMHNSPDVWGFDAHIFNGKRFLKTHTTALSREQRKLQKQGFTPFGGGTALCPGRHFATTEILGVAATIVMGFEITGRGGAPLEVPRGKKQAMSVSMKQPAGEVEALIRRREGFAGVKWTYNIAGEVGMAHTVF